MAKDFKYYKVRQMSRLALIAMRKAGEQIDNLNETLDELMQEFEKNGLTKEKFNKIIRWENQGRINNLFKIGA
jgi:hypothetical protein